jgi:hypothetical protein
VKQYERQEFKNFPKAGVLDFYNHIISLSPIKNFYLCSIFIKDTFRGTPKRRMIYKEYDNNGEPYMTETLFTGAGACGYGSIVEKVHFTVGYRNINHKKYISRTGLYIRGCCGEDSRTGGYKIIWRMAHGRDE